MKTREELIDLITEYLCVGGLWNPELMEHEKVRDLLMDCRKFLLTDKREHAESGDRSID